MICTAFDASLLLLLNVESRLASTVIGGRASNLSICTGPEETLNALNEVLIYPHSILFDTVNVPYLYLVTGGNNQHYIYNFLF